MKSKAIVRFTKISLLDEHSSKKSVYVDGIRATITIDSKTNLIYEFPAPTAKKLDKKYLDIVPHEIKTNFLAHLEAYLKGFESLEGSHIENIINSPAQIDTLKSSGIHTLEGLLECNEHLADLDIENLKFQAKAFLANKSLEEQKYAELEEKYVALEKIHLELLEQKK